MKPIARIAAIAALMSAMAIGTCSCTDDSCYDNGSSLPIATTYVGSSQQTVTGLTIMGIGVPGDSLLLDSASVSEFYLPLRPSASTTSFKLQRWYHNAWVRDTLTIDYEPIEYFHSLECGAMFNFDIERVCHTTHAIDSIALLTKLITNSRTPAIRIYFTQ